MPIWRRTGDWCEIIMDSIYAHALNQLLLDSYLDQENATIPIQLPRGAWRVYLVVSTGRQMYM